MWKLHGYYLKEVLVNAAITFLVLFAVVLVSVVYKAIQLAAGGDPFDALLITLFLALDSFQHLLTISFLLATLMTYTRAAQDRELVAIRAAGISPRVPMTSALLVGLLLTALGSFALHYVIPTIHYNKYHIVNQVVRNAVLSLGLGTDRIKLKDFLMTFGGSEAGEYRECVIYTKRPLLGFKSPILFVDRVSIPKLEEDRTSMLVELVGVREPFGGLHQGSLKFDVSYSEISSRERRADRDDDLRSDQLLAEVLREMHPRPFEAIYTLYRRCCFALMPAMLAPIGYCLAEMARERGRVFALVLSLLPLSLFYLGELLGARFLLSTQHPACGWMPALLLALLGVPLCWRQLRR